MRVVAIRMAAALTCNGADSPSDDIVSYRVPVTIAY